VVANIEEINVKTVNKKNMTVPKVILAYNISKFNNWIKVGMAK
jgi:hypothetical protein